MSKFKFSVSNLENRREGVIESESFDDAVFTLGKHVKACGVSRTELSERHSSDRAR